MYDLQHYWWKLFIFFYLMFSSLMFCVCRWVVDSIDLHRCVYVCFFHSERLRGEPGDTGQDGTSATHHGRATGAASCGTHQAVHTRPYACTQTRTCTMECQIWGAAAAADGHWTLSAGSHSGTRHRLEPPHYLAGDGSTRRIYTVIADCIIHSSTKILCCITFVLFCCFCVLLFGGVRLTLGFLWGT